jgi:hypothetical protein
MSSRPARAATRCRNHATDWVVPGRETNTWEAEMGRSLLLLLLGVPIPIIILLALFWH